MDQQESNHGFQLHQQVMLKSGGPVMTIIGFSPNGRIWCQWERRPDWIDEASFVPEALLAVKEM